MMVYTDYFSSVYVAECQSFKEKAAHSVDRMFSMQCFPFWF